MNSNIKRFFNKHVSQLHRHARTDESCFLDLEFGTVRDSYFSTPVHARYIYLNTISFESKGELEKDLNDLWKDQPALLRLIPDLIDLAFNLKEEQKEQSAELSPFVYEMF